MREFLKKMLSSDKDVSSKRFNGSYGFAIFCFLVIFVVLRDSIPDGKLEDASVVLLKTLAYTSVLLLGVTLAENSKLMK